MRAHPGGPKSGQPDTAGLATLAEVGVHDVMNLRTAAEPMPFEERAVAKRLGLKYLAIPTGGSDFTDARFTAFRHHLIAHGPKKRMGLRDPELTQRIWEYIIECGCFGTAGAMRTGGAKLAENLGMLALAAVGAGPLARELPTSSAP